MNYVTKLSRILSLKIHNRYCVRLKGERNPNVNYGTCSSCGQARRFESFRSDVQNLHHFK